MAGHSYLGTNRMKKVWLGTTPIKKMWLGTDNVFSAGFEFTYTGQYDFTGSADGDWQLKLLTSGILKITSLPTLVDYFMIGSGKKGDDGLPASGSGWSPGVYGAGGKGGDGGEYLQNTDGSAFEETSYSVTIGTNGGETTLGSLSTANGSASGIGGASSGRGNNNGQAGSDGVTAFDGEKYGAGGGSGSAYRTDGYGTAGAQTGGAGGDIGGGDGASVSGWADPKTGVAQAGINNTGSGGGGGGSYSQYNFGQHMTSAGANGGSGIAILRNHR